MLNRTRLVRLLWVLALLAAVAAAVFAVMRTFNDNLVLFYTPTQLQQGAAAATPPGRSVRLGGMVERGSLHATPGTLVIRFRVTDQLSTLPVTYTGITPDLFKEGKGVVAQGRLQDGVFVATEILAKHDENYTPPALKK